MDLSQKQWMYGGAGSFVAVSAVIVMGGVPNVWVPMPLPIVLMAYLTMVIFPFVTPVLYILVLKFFSSSKHFSKVVLALVVVLGTLNILYFQSAWGYGVKYQGPEHTKIVVIENLVGFGAALVLAVIAITCLLIRHYVSIVPFFYSVTLVFNQNSDLSRCSKDGVLRWV